MKKIILSLLGICQLLLLFAQTPSQTIRGKVLDANNNKAITEANIALLGTNFSTASTADGSFSLEKVPVGRYQLQVSHVAYQIQILQELLVVSGKENIIDIQLLPKTSNLEEVLISGFKADATRQGVAGLQVITNEAVLCYPATFFDPARLAMALPGVVNDNDQANGMVIRGNNPNTMGWSIEGLEVVNPNHLTNAGTTDDQATVNAGGTNALSAQLMDKTMLFSGAYSAEYGNALGGIMDVSLRNGNDKKWEYTGQAGLIGLDMAVEGPVGKGSILANYRYSTVGLLSLMGLKFGDEDIRFQDFSFKYHVPTKNNGAFNLFGVVGQSDNLFAANQDTTLWKYEKDNQDINYHGKLAIFGMNYQHNFKNQKTIWKTGFAYSKNQNEKENIVYNNKFQEKANYTNVLNFIKLTFDSHIKHYFNKKNTLTLGLNLLGNGNGASYTNNNNNHQDLFLSNTGVYLQPYTQFQTSFGSRFLLDVGLRWNAFFAVLNEKPQQVVEPKTSLQYRINPKSTLTAAYGLQSQMLPYAYSSYAEKLSKVHHFVLSYQQQLNPTWSFKIEPYFQIFKDLKGNFLNSNIDVTLSVDGLRNINKAQNYGIEFSTQKSFISGFYAFANLSLYEAKYLDPSTQKWTNTRFNGNYAANASLGKEWTKEKRNKQVVWGTNARLVQVGGYRYTPSGTNVEPFSAKQKDYFRIDARAYWKRNKQKFSSTLSLDIQNLTNAQNVAFTYYDTRQKTNVVKYQLGLIPILNYRIEF